VSDLQQQIEALGPAAKAGARSLAKADTAKKNAMLESIARKLESNRGRIAAANALDLEKGKENGLSRAMLDRLHLTESRLQSMVKGVRQVALLPDPVGEVLKDWTLPNGLELSKIRVPLGVIGIIYESRPNVTVDATVLCLKTGNAVILRGGSEAFESNKVLVELMREAMEESGVSADGVGFVPVTDREAIPILCRMDRWIDLMIPRGGHGLIETVVRNARMPVIKHFHGVCQIYVHEAADFGMAEDIIVNAKCQRPGVCNSVETVLVDEKVAGAFLPKLAARLRAEKVVLKGDAPVSRVLGETLPEPEAWDIEYLDLILALRIVRNLDEAVEHIERYGSHHSDSIVTADREAAEKFLREVDSSAVYWNASTRFTDGSEFGFGAEIGISTDKIHARGPMGLEELTSYKYLARGSGQIRP